MHGTISSFRRARIVRRDDSWTFVESEFLRKHWPDVEYIRKHLKHRTERAIRNMAKKCGLIPDKQQHIWTAAEQSKLRRLAAVGAARKDMAKELGLTVQQVANRLLYSKINIAKRRPVIVGDPLVNSVRQRAFDLNISLVELDRSLGKKRWFSHFNQSKGASLPAVGRAVKAMGGTLTIQWNDA